MKVGEAFARSLTMTLSFLYALRLLTDCKFGNSIVYKSRLQSTKNFPDRGENNRVKLTVNNILYVLHKCTRTVMMNGLEIKEVLLNDVLQRGAILQSIQTLGCLLFYAPAERKKTKKLFFPPRKSGECSSTVASYSTKLN